MDRDEQRLAAGRALVAKVLAEAAAREVKASRRAIEPTLVAGEKVKAVLPDGRLVGNVQLTEQPATVVVSDEVALLEYVKRTRPDEVLTREYVRESYLNHLKAMAKQQLTEDTGGEVVDARGEIVPGLELDYGTPRYLPTVAGAPGRRAIGEVLGRLLGPELAGRLELPAPPRAVPDDDEPAS